MLQHFKIAGKIQKQQGIDMIYIEKIRNFNLKVNLETRSKLLRSETSLSKNRPNIVKKVAKTMTQKII